MTRVLIIVLLSALTTPGVAADGQSTDQGLRPDTRLTASPEGNAAMRDYLASLGVPPPIIDRAIAAEPSEMYWLSTEDQRALGIKRIK
jgi:hypothetical protein